jgi:HAD superfamily hydrolase (TIGR01509 family)
MIRSKDELDSCRPPTIKTEAVIFDMDGVILDSEPRHERAFLEVCNEIGVGEDHGLIFSEYIGRSDAEFWADFLTKNQLDLNLEQVREMKRKRVIEYFRHERPFYPGLQQLVEHLAPSYRLALASGSERLIIDAVLAIGDLNRYFEVTVTSSEVPAGKPRPDIFLKTASLLGIEPRNCWVIEDSRPGIAAGLAAGMRVIAVTNTHPAEELADATHVVSSCAEIQKLLPC